MDDFAPYQWQTESAFVEAQSISRLSVHTLRDIPQRKKTDFHFPQQYQREKSKTQKTKRTPLYSNNLEFIYSARQKEIKNQSRSKLLAFGSEGILPVRI